MVVVSLPLSLCVVCNGSSDGVMDEKGELEAIKKGSLIRLPFSF